VRAQKLVDNPVGHNFLGYWVTRLGLVLVIEFLLLTQEQMLVLINHSPLIFVFWFCGSGF
jgi:hypothetical protein